MADIRLKTAGVPVDPNYVTTVRRSALALLAAAALAGCGSDAADDVAPQGATTAPRAQTANAGVTAGSTGPAITQAAGGDAAQLAPGGEIDAGSGRPTPRQREGVGAGAACADVELLPATATLGQVADATLCLLNGERIDRGLAPLTRNAKLADAALAHARDMVARQYFAHESPDGSRVSDRIGLTGYLPDAGWVIGENLAWGTGSLASPRGIMNAWMGSEGHRRNILDARYEEIGLGIALGNPSSANGAGATFATTFGAIKGTPATAPGSTGTAPRTAVARERRALRRAAKRTLRRCKRLRRKRARACRARAARLARTARRL